MEGWALDAVGRRCMSTDELGMCGLRHVDDTTEARNKFTNFDAWRGSVGRSNRTDRLAQRATYEVVQWLPANAFVMQNPSQSSDAFVSIAGDQILRSGLHRHQIAERLDVEVAPALQLAKELFRQGRFDTAAFEPMKTVGVQVRDSAGLGHDAVGVKLMCKAFGAGRLTDESQDPGERVAVMELCAGPSVRSRTRRVTRTFTTTARPRRPR